MVIIALADIHGQTGNIDKLGGILSMADIILLAGDITHFGDEKQVKAVIDKITPLNNRILAVPGNCDYSGVSNYLFDEDINVHNTKKQLNDYSFYGLGGSLPCPGKTPNEYTEEEYEMFVSSLIKENEPESHNILMSHQPPSNTVNDRITTGLHVGSHVIRKFIEWLQPLIVFTGHIHEGVGIDEIGNTKIINPGPFGEGRYAYARIFEEQILELEIREV